jgi:polyhydroxyalkanoate synthesis repressor PhaR
MYACSRAYVNMCSADLCSATTEAVVAAETVVIKKYGNRRMYDTSTSRYINLEDIAAMVRNGTDVQVVDARTGDDLTRTTLTQIIAERAKDEPAGLPLELLRQLIVASDHVGQQFIMWYLKSAFDSYHKVQNAMQSGLSDLQTAALNPLSLMERFMPKKAEAPAVMSQTAEPQESRELREMRERLAELEAKTKKKPAPSKRRAKPRAKARAKS